MEGGKRMAVLAGCNYPHLWEGWQLNGCIYDVVSMKKVLISKFGFKEDEIELLTDEPTSSNKPACANIKRALNRMVECAQEGDLLFFHFSGHGTLIPARDPKDPKREHEAIITSDLNVIKDVEFRQLVARIHHKATFTILSDSCHSGGLIDQEKEQIGPRPSTSPPKPLNKCFKRKFIPFESLLNLQQITGVTTLNTGNHMIQPYSNNVITCCGASFSPTQNYRLEKTYDNGVLISGCQSDECSEEDESSKPPRGVFSYAVRTVLDNIGRQVSNKEIVMLTRELLRKQGGRQHPCLYCSDENADATFLMQRQPSTN